MPIKIQWYSEVISKIKKTKAQIYQVFTSRRSYNINLKRIIKKTIKSQRPVTKKILNSTKDKINSLVCRESFTKKLDIYLM